MHEKQHEISGKIFGKLFSDKAGAVAGNQELPEEAMTAWAELMRHDPGEVNVRMVKSDLFEFNRISIEPEKCVVEAGCAEGLRRGLYRLADLLKSGRPLGTTESHAVIRDRVGRSFMAPINRPPLYHDELMDDFNFYPDGYLNELARSGVNGVWVSSDFKKISHSFLLPEDSNRGRRIRRLNEIIRQCARYGIRVYIFCIEPISFAEDDPTLEKYPELRGTPVPGKFAFCPDSATAQRHLFEITNHLFTDAPGLGGIIDLSVGEWTTLCSNIPGSVCPRCGKTPQWKAHGKSLSALNAGMKAAAPQARLISWPYTQISYWGYDEALEGASHMPEGVALMHNFESYGEMKQYGKLRKVTDYWLSFVGPSKFFKQCAERCRAAGTDFFAKLQVSCSTEIATTQYLPVPAMLYRKFQELRKLNVSGVSLGWYFGSFPSVMTEALGRLCRSPFPASENQFLVELARIHWGEEAPTAAKAWKIFSDAFSGYPMVNVLAYVGPMHDSIVWKLHLKPVNRRLAPGWNNLFTPGDRIHECLVPVEQHDDGFELAEMASIIKKMSSRWNRGVELMRSLKSSRLPMERRVEIETAEAVGLLFEDAAEIFEFYLLREKLLNGAGRALKRMRTIVQNAIRRSLQMLPLIARNPSLGYHSEATDYKFSPVLIRSRLRHLQKILDRDFPEAERALASGRPPYPEATGEKTRGPVADINGKAVKLSRFGYREVTWEGAYLHEKFIEVREPVPNTEFKAESDSENLYLTITYDRIRENDRFQILWEPLRSHWPERITVWPDGRVSYTQRQVNLKAETDGNSVRLILPLKRFGLTEKSRSRINIERAFEENGEKRSVFWVAPHFMTMVFVLGNYNPSDYGWLIPADEKREEGKAVGTPSADSKNHTQKHKKGDRK